MRILNLDILKKGLPGISEAVGAFLVEAAVVCLEINGHKNGTILKVSGIYSESFRLDWQPIKNIDAYKSWNDLKEATEYGATAIALLLVMELTEYDGFERIPQSGVGDYVLIKDANMTTENLANLEISGILKETPGNTVTMRLNIKRRNPKNLILNTLPGLIIVAEFSVPKAKIIKL